MTQPTNEEIRAWARAHGLPVADRGRLPAHIVDAYAQAQSPAAQPPGSERTTDAHTVAVPGQSTAPPYRRPEPYGAQEQYGGPPPSGYLPPYGGPPPYGSEPPYGTSGAPTPPGTDGLAIASLIVAFAGGGLIAVGLGMAALRRIRRSGRDGRGLAIGGIVVGALGALLWLSIILAIIFAIASDDGVAVDGTERNEGGSVTSSGDVSISALKVRDCTGPLPDTDAPTLRVVPCSQPHAAEVFAVFPLEGDLYPGDAEVDRFAQGGCDREFTLLVDDEPETPPFELFYYSPTEESWRVGDRTVICLLTAPPGEFLSGSAVDRARQAG